jgi:N-acetylglucosaminyldiphosphoundecaprenol N-acetyl-beta-D-mannosaminyltransferase
MKKNRDNFNLKYWKISNINLFSRGEVEVLNMVNEWIESKNKKKWIVTANPEFVMKSTKDKKFEKLLNEADLRVVDGVGLIWARQLKSRSKKDGGVFGKRLVLAMKIGREILAGEHREELVTGVDLIKGLCEMASKKNYKVYFLGGFGDRAEKTANYFKSKMPDLKYQFCAGEPGFTNEEVVEKINKFKPDILLVAYGMKKQEEWIYENKNKIDFGVAVGVGRSFDYYSGDLKRAPKVWRKMGLEWFYSLIKEPKRLKRQLQLPGFVWKVLRNLI